MRYLSRVTALFSRRSNAVASLLPLKLALLAVVSSESAAIPQPPVVMNGAPDTLVPTFALSPASYSIGGLQDDRRYELLRLGVAAVTSMGELVVAEAQGRELRMYDSSGRFLRIVGAVGDGPGEFRGISKLVILPGDSLLIYDGSRRVLLLFDPRGNFVRDMRSFPAMHCCLRDWSFAYTEDVSYLEITRPYLNYQLVETGAAGAQTKKPFLRLLHDDPDAMGPLVIGPGNQRSRQILASPFKRVSHLAVTWDEFIYSDGEHLGYTVFDRNGEIRITVRSDLAPRPVTRADVVAARQDFQSRYQSSLSLRMLEEAFASFTIPATHPAHRRLLAEPEGRVWVESASRGYWVGYSRSGRMLGILRAPAVGRIVHFAFGFAIVAQSDPLALGTRVSVHRVVQ